MISYHFVYLLICLIVIEMPQERIYVSFILQFHFISKKINLVHL
jgi:hypothetical protein